MCVHHILCIGASSNDDNGEVSSGGGGGVVTSDSRRPVIVPRVSTHGHIALLLCQKLVDMVSGLQLYQIVVEVVNSL